MPPRSLHVALGYLPLLVGCAAIFAVSSMSQPPIPAALLFENSDKVLHAIAYCALAVLALVGAQARRGALSRGASLEATLIAFLYGVSDELHQGFVPGRSSSVADLAADVAGGALGAYVVGVMLLRAWGRRAARQPS